MKQFLRYILTLVAILIATTPTWAGQAHVYAKSDPTDGGYVHVATSQSEPSYTTTESHNEQGGFGSSGNKTFYLYYTEKPGYKFKGWLKTDNNYTCNTNSTTNTTDGWKVTQTATGIGAQNSYYVAIFATLQSAAHNTTVQFNDTKVDEQSSKSITIKHSHAGTVSLSLSGTNAGDFSLNENSFTSTSYQEGRNITIYFKPTCVGERTATLTISSNNGLNSLTIYLKGNGLRHTPTDITWQEPIDVNMFIGDSRTVNVNSTTDGNITYSSSNTSVLSVSGNTLTAKAEGIAIITATQAATCKYEAVSITKTFTVNNKKTPTFWLNGDPDQLTDNLKTEDTRTITITNVDERMTADYDPNLLSYTFNGSTAIIKALDAGTATLKLTQPENNQIFYGERTFTFYITKYDTNTITNDLATNYMVDDVVAEADIYTINNHEVPVEIISGNNNVLKFENGQLKAVGAGTTTLTVKQSATNKWVERTATKTITVHKYDITATINPDNAVWNQLVTPNPFSASTQHKFSGATSAVTGFTVTQQNNEHIAKLNNTNYTIQTYYTNGDVNFLITRPADYKYNALSQTLTLHVNQSNETCYLLDPCNGSFECSLVWQEREFTPTAFTGTPDTLFFEARSNNSTRVGEVTVQQKVNGTWQNIANINPGTSYSTYKYSLNPATTQIRFYNGYGSYTREFKNVRVTRAKSLTPSDSLVILPVTSIGTPETKTFTLKWSTCADEILLTNSNPHFTINTHNISSTAGQGSTAITVTCDASVVGTLRDTIVIYDQTQRIFVPVECIVNDKFIANIKGTTAYSKKVDDTWVADFKFDTCQTTLPSDDINAPFYYTIEHDLTGNDVLKPGYEKQVISYNPQNDTITAHNAGTAVITFIQRPTESHYTDTLRCVITVTKYTTSFDLKGRTTYYTGDEDPYNALFNVFTNNDEVPMTFTSGDESIINYENDALRALCAGTTSFTVAQAESYKWLGHTQTIPSITVSKYNSNFSLTNNGADITCLIGDKIDALSLYTTANNEILPTIKSDNPEVVSFNHTTRQLEANTAGEAVITISQPTDCKWTEYTATRKIIVQKHTPVFTFQKPVYFNDTIVDYFTTSNTQTALTIASQTDTDVAIAYFDQNNPNDLHTTNLISFNKEDTTIITFTQEENWYWYARTYIDTIVPIDPNNHVTFTIDQQNKVDIFYVSHSSGNNMSWSNGAIQVGNVSDGFEYAKELVIRFTGIPKDLTFTYGVANSGTTGEVWDVYESTDGTNWSASIWHQEGESGTCNKQPLNPDTRFLKFRYGGNFGCYFKNIHVTELNEFEAVPNVLDFGLQYVDNPKTTKSFDFKYANAGYKVQLESTDSHFTVEPTYIDTIGGEKHGTIKATVTYHPTEEHNTANTDAKIYIWDEAGHKDSVILTASAIKSTPTLSWTPAWSATEPIVLLDQTVTNAATSSNGYSTVKYRSSDEDIIQIINDGAAFKGKGTGRVEITAYQEPDRVYNAAEISKTFIVTDKIAQYIVWEDNLTNLRIGDDPITLNAQVWVMTDAASNTWEYSPAQTAELQYSSPDSDIVSIENNILTINGVGELLIDATIQADETYEYAHAQIPVRVRDNSTTCSDEDLIIPVKKDGTAFELTTTLEYNPYLSTSEHIVEIDRTAGIPGELIFGYYGREAWWTLSGRIRVYESSDNGSTWQQVLSDADAVKPKAQELQYSPRIPLSTTATHIKFQRFESTNLGYHYIQFITVLPAKYIQAEDIDWGNIYVGNTPDTTITFNYSSVRSDMVLSTSHANLSVTPTRIVKDCGDWGTESLTITLNANTSIIGEFHEQVFIHDQVGNISETIHVYANIVKNSPTITWTPTDTIRSSAEWETKKTAIASSGDQVLYEITAGNQPNEYAYLNNDSKMILLRGGWITARAYTAETTTSNEVSADHNFFIIVDPLFEDFSNDSNWHNANNWNIGRIPWTTDSATIAANKHVSLDTVIITEGLSFESGGSIHITSTGGLTVGAQGIQGAASDGSSIIIDNLKTGAGFLRISPEYNGAMPHATINYQTRSTLDSGANQNATWQYIGAPGANCQFTVDGITWLYQWSEPRNWLQHSGTLTLTPFAGYAITQYGQPTYSLKADPIQANQTITLTKTPEASGGMNGDNLFANSYMAPIDVKNFTAEDFSDYNTGREDIVKTFYIFNSGSWNDWNKNNENGSTLGSNGSTTPGQYCAIPALSAKYLDSEYDITTIPPMQGVYVIANENNATIRLNYNKHVWQAGTYTDASTDLNEPMRAPQRQAQEQMQQDDFRRLRLQVNSANSGADRMYIIQESTTTRGYDNGYDAPNQVAEGIANIYTNEPFGKMEVSCANNIDSMYIGFQAGADNYYTLSFRSLIGDSLYLKDMEMNTIIRMQEGAEYRFCATPYTTNDLRFLLLLHPQWESDNTPTQVDQVQQTTIWNDSQRLYITNAPAHSVASIYTLSGQPILHSTVQYTTHTIDIHHLPQGVYILRINNQIYKFVCQ